MAVSEPNMLSEIANQLSRFISSNVSGNPRVVIGPPADAVPSDANAEPVVNLFIYKLGPSGFHPDADSSDPFQVRMQCLITAFGKTVSSGAAGSSVLSEGEVTLRILGSVIQQFHQNPVQHVALPGGGPLAQSSLQIVFIPLSIEELNQIWATQGDAIFRTSLAYEIALAPIVSVPTPPMPPRVAKFSTEIAPNIEGNKTEPEVKISPEISFNDNAGKNAWSAETWPRPNKIFVSRFTDATAIEGNPRLDIKITLPAGLIAPHKLIVRQILPTESFTSETNIGAAGVRNIELPAANGDYLVYVDTQNLDTDDTPTHVRSNILSINLSGIPRPADDGGTP